MNVLVFRTNMVCAGCVQTVGQALSPFESTIRWTVDLDDCDRALRVEMDDAPEPVITADVLMDTLPKAGFIYEELL